MKRILVVGGGFAGLNAALAAKLRGGDAVAVSLLSPEPRIEIRPRLYEADPGSMTADLLAPLGTAGIGFVQGRAADLDVAGHRERHAPP
jgi:NADH dehydrogenase